MAQGNMDIHTHMKNQNMACQEGAWTDIPQPLLMQIEVGISLLSYHSASSPGDHIY